MRLAGQVWEWSGVVWTYMLVDQQNGNVLALAGEAVECCLDGAVFRLGVDDEEVLLRVWRLGDVLYIVSPLCLDLSLSSWGLTPTPASSMPVTVSYHTLAMGTEDRGERRRTSSPMTARNCRSLYAEAGAAMIVVWTAAVRLRDVAGRAMTTELR